jgi:hypothetical protein
MNDASAPAGAPTMTDANTKPSATNSIRMQNSPRKIARKQTAMLGLECLQLLVKWSNLLMKNTTNGRTTHHPSSAKTMAASAFARAKCNRDDAYAVIHQIQARSQEIRETDRQLLAEEQATQWNTTAANALKAILKRERDAIIFPLFRTWINGPQNGSLDKLWTPDDPLDLKNTSWTALIEKQAIFEALLQNGSEHFSQASDTPFFSGPAVAELIGPFEFNDISKQILQGNFDIDSITDDIQLHAIVKAMAHSDPMNPIESDSELTIEKPQGRFLIHQGEYSIKSQWPSPWHMENTH